MNGAIEACVGAAGTAATFGLALAHLRGLRRDVYGTVSNRFLAGLAGPETDMYEPQHTECVVGSGEVETLKEACASSCRMTTLTSSRGWGVPVRTAVARRRRRPVVRVRRG